VLILSRPTDKVNRRPHLPENPLIVSVTIEGVIEGFLLALPGYEELIIERAVQHQLGDWSAWICSAEDLIIQKVVAGVTKTGWMWKRFWSSSTTSWTRLIC
jgi:hypothetical protein